MNIPQKLLFKHFAFWIIFWFIQSLLFSGGQHLDVYLSKNVAIVALQAGIVYINLLLLSKLLDQSRYLLYCISALALTYSIYALSGGFIAKAFEVFIPDVNYILSSDAYWLPTDFWRTLSGSAPYSIALMASTIFYLIKSKKDISTAQEHLTEENGQVTESEDHTLMLKEGKVVHRLDVREILFIQGMKEYVSWHTQDKKVVTLHSLTSLEDLLGSKGFLRTHKSYIVNTKCVSLVKYDSVEIPGKRIPIGRSYRDRVQDKFRSDV